jgi:SAM-dependent methyltransferase
MKNIKYKTTVLSNTYSNHRICWDEFYKSEKVILEKTGISTSDSILDLGCGCGGLGIALNERFGNTNYTGIDINEPSIRKSKNVNSFGKFYCGDILDCQFDHFRSTFDKVISFSCIDWNIEFEAMFKRSWSFVKPGGYLIISLRLTDQNSILDITRSFQQIDENFKAQYVVLNINETMEKIKELNPSKVNSYGYWGTVNKLYGNKTKTSYDEVCFSVFSIKKRIDETYPIQINLELPLRI